MRMAAMNVLRTSFIAIVGLMNVAVNSVALAQGRDNYAESRARMVDDMIAAEGVKNEKVLESMRATPRHQFVKQSLKHLAYSDQALDIGFKQTISPPFIV